MKSIAVPFRRPHWATIHPSDLYGAAAPIESSCTQVTGQSVPLPNPGNNFWSSTENYNNAANAWNVNLNNGNTNNNTKTTLNYVRCVRP